MAVKLNLSTPPADIVKTLAEEGPKCRRWYVKRSGGEDKLEEKMQQMFKTCIENHNDIILTKPIDYNPTSGNHWVGFEYAIPIKETMHFRRSFETCVVWETEGYFGMFYHAGDKNDDKRDIFIFTPHFFQRYCERMDVDSLGLVTLQGFLSENDCYRTAFYEKDGEKRIYLRLHKCIGLGKVLSETPLVAEIRTVISDAMMSSNQLAETEQMRKEYDELVADRFSASKEDKEEARLELKFQDMKSRLGDVLKIVLADPKWYNKINTENAFECCLRVYGCAVASFGRITGKKYELGDLLVDRFTVETILKLAQEIKKTSPKDDFSFCLTKYAKAYLEIAWHNDIDITFEQIQEEVRIHYDNNSYNKYQQNKENLMNQQSVSMFKNLLSRTGLTKKFSKYSSGIDDNTDRYLRDAEPIYFITRFINVIVDIKDKDKFIAANKTWMQLVVENGFCPQLKTYIDQHGKQIVADAICYLIDNNLWISPEDKKSLRKQQPDTFKGLEDIPSAVEYLKENHNEEKTEKEESIEPVVEFAEEHLPAEPVPSAPALSNVSEELQNARNAADKIINAMVLLTESAKSIKDYVAHEDIGSLYEEENNMLKAKLKEQEYVSSREIASLNNKLSAKIEEIKTSQAKLHAEEKARKEEQQRAYDARQERAAMATELDDVKKQLRKAQAELDELRNKAKKSETQRLITYRVSELEYIPMVGAAVLKGIVPYLEKKSGVIVIRDGEKWDDGVRYDKKR